MTNDAQRIFRLEGLVRTLSQQVLALQVALAQTAQNQATAGVVGGGSSGGSSGAFVAIANTGVPAASGNPGGGTAPGSTVGTVFQITGGGYLNLGSFTIYNPMLNATNGAHTLIVEPVGDGTYMVIGESCQ